MAPDLGGLPVTEGMLGNFFMLFLLVFLIRMIRDGEKFVNDRLVLPLPGSPIFEAHSSFDRPAGASRRWNYVPSIAFFFCAQLADNYNQLMARIQ